MIRISRFDGMPVRREDGERLGRVHEVHADGGEVKALVCGSGGLLQRLSQSRRGLRIPWSEVKAIGPDGVVVRTRPSRRRKAT
jgi:sporulation protein YlmC with PRC-barrel domain